MAITRLQLRVAKEILAIARRDDLALGDRLHESLLAEQIGTSRTPVNVALRHLTSLGVLTHDPNRGYFLVRAARDLRSIADRLSEEPAEPLYLKIAEDRLAHKLPMEVSEVELMRQYNVSRSVLRKVLSIMQEEGWLERQIGQGWQFLPMIDSSEAYDESYLFRIAVEPSGLLSPFFKCNTSELMALRSRQRFIVEGGFQSMTSVELFEANREFHETVANWSGNRFITQAVRRMDRLRRLVEYRQAKDRRPRLEQATEHLGILDAIERGTLSTAARRLREHLEGARRAKTQSKGVFSP